MCTSTVNVPSDFKKCVTSSMLSHKETVTRLCISLMQ